MSDSDTDPPLHPQRVKNPDAECPRAGNKDVRALLQECWDLGCYVTPTKNGHFWVYPPSNEGGVNVAGSPSDHRGMRNVRSLLRRRFVPVDKR